MIPKLNTIYLTYGIEININDCIMFITIELGKADVAILPTFVLYHACDEIYL